MPKKKDPNFVTIGVMVAKRFYEKLKDRKKKYKHSFTSTVNDALEVYFAENK